MSVQLLAGSLDNKGEVLFPEKLPANHRVGIPLGGWGGGGVGGWAGVEAGETTQIPSSQPSQIPTFTAHSLMRKTENK